MKKILLLISVALAAVLAMQWRDWPRPSPAGDALPVQGSAELTISPAASPAVASLGPREDYAVISERPLFVPSRRPPEEEPEAQTEDIAAEIADLERLDVSAILILSPENASVWLKDPAVADRSLVRLRVGDVYEGWTVADIKTDQVVMETQGATHTLELLDFSRPDAQSPAARRQVIRQPVTRTPPRPR